MEKDYFEIAQEFALGLWGKIQTDDKPIFHQTKEILVETIICKKCYKELEKAEEDGLCSECRPLFKPCKIKKDTKICKCGAIWSPWIKSEKSAQVTRYIIHNAHEHL